MFALLTTIRLSMTIAFLFLLPLCLPTSLAYVTTAPPTVTRTKPSPTVPPPLVQSFLPKIRFGKRQIHMREFAQIPFFENRPSRIVGLTRWNDDIYVTTSTSGAYVYKVSSNGTVTLWMEVQKIVNGVTGNDVDCINSKHGGVRGIAFPPNFDKTGLFYISYLELQPKNRSAYQYLTPPFNNEVADSIVAEFRFNKKRNMVQKRYMRYVLRISNLDYDHPIKQIAFQGNKLLIGHGDGSQGSFPKQGGMLNNGLGKVLRIDPRQQGSKPYRIPFDNPYRDNPNYINELYAIGLRNPHNICVSKAHGIFVTDAGRDNVEEVNIIKPGKNYGWQEREGTFVHLKEGGTLTGIKPLPKDDAKYGYTYPNIQVPHWAPEGKNIFGQALAGSCPIENKSPLHGLFLYANFAEDGQFYYSFVGQMKRAVTEGDPKNLTQATIYVATAYFDHDNDPSTPPKVVKTLRDVVRFSTPKAVRVDMRFGLGPKGQILWSSKVSGKLYEITSSLPGAKI